ncbi:hypothetical protein HK414_12910 [Ramlibacter terrae]|uniref:DUF1992 domain-containing protein n=1 Tax=Ramlibacter terrae TaxID=2732511 RepID=A0ABX6P441_9BURK|nr:hypothetical protein HK414_12910 [Ramlibacter terrae]
MYHDKAETLRALQLPEGKLREYEAQPGPGPSDPTYPLWTRHLQVMREEASVLRTQLVQDASRGNAGA